MPFRRRAVGLPSPAPRTATCSSTDGANYHSMALLSPAFWCRLCHYHCIWPHGTLSCVNVAFRLPLYPADNRAPTLYSVAQYSPLLNPLVCAPYTLSERAIDSATTARTTALFAVCIVPSPRTWSLPRQLCKPCLYGAVGGTPAWQRGLRAYGCIQAVASAAFCSLAAPPSLPSASLPLLASRPLSPPVPHPEWR